MTNLALPDNSCGFGPAVLAVCLGIAASLASAPVAAQTAPPGFAQNYSANASNPVEIESESLEVDDKKKTATFKGKVVVVQGEFTLKSDQIVVHYVNVDKSGTGAAKPVAATAAPGAGADITTIDAVGNVLVTNKNGQTVSGGRANFDVKKQIVVLEDHAVASQGETVIKGDRLIVNAVDGTYMVDAKRSGRLSATFKPGAIKEQLDQTKAQGQAETKGKKKPAEGGPRHPAQPAESAAQPNAWRAENAVR